MPTDAAPAATAAKAYSICTSFPEGLLELSGNNCFKKITWLLSNRYILLPESSQ